MTHPLIRLFACIAAFLPLTAAAQTINKPPSISGSPPTNVQVGRLYSFRPIASDPEGRTLYFRISNRPGWANFDATTGRLWGTPESKHIGRFRDIRIAVGDGVTSRSLPLFTITVSSASTATTNTAPVISGNPPTSGRVGQAYYFRPTASDREGNPLTFSIANRPSWASFNTTNGTLSGTPGSGTAGTYSSITIRVSDGRVTSSLPAFAINVQSASTGNTAPTISGTPPASARVGQSYSFRPTASDGEGNPLTFSIANRPSWVSFNTTNGTLSGTPGSGTAGTYANIAIRVSDGQVTSSLPAFTINVQPASTSGTGSAALAWLPPIRRTDGTLLTNLAGFQIRYGTSDTDQPNVIRIGSPLVTTALVTELAPATYYFSVCAFDANGVASAYTAPVSIRIL